MAGAKSPLATGKKADARTAHRPEERKEMSDIQEFDEITGGCLWGCDGDSIDGHAESCNWHIVAALQAERAEAIEAMKPFADAYLALGNSHTSGIATVNEMRKLTSWGDWKELAELYQKVTRLVTVL